MISPSPQCVGQEFVRQYYTMLHEAPDFMHRFYSHDSSFIHGGHEDGSVHGQINIHKKILSLNFRDCHARIRQVDSLGTIDDAVVVQVSGELSNDGRPMRRFVQTFVLAPQSPKKYYVHNDIFRYQDEVFVEDCDLSGTTPCTSTADSPESCCSSSISKSQEHQNSSDQSVHTASLNSPSKGKVIQSPATPPGRNDDPPGSEGGERDGRPTKTDGGEGNESSNGHGRESARAREVSNDPGRGRKDDESHCDETKGCKNGQMATAPPCPGGKTPQSWASVTSSKKLQSTMQSYGFAEDCETSDRDGVGNGGFRLSRESPSVSFPPASTGQEDCRMSEIRQEIVREEKLDGRTVRSAEASRHQDPIQLFVGNLPNDVAASTLRKIFNKFGEVLDVRINRKVSANRDVPNFGFLSLDTLDTARKILEARPFHLDNGHRLNVEEKKSDQARLGQSDAGVRQRSRPTPTTRPSSSGRGRWGGYRGGEGRSGSSSKSFDRFGSGPSGGFEGKVGRE